MTARNVWFFLPGITDAKRDPRNRMRRLRGSRWGYRPAGPARVVPFRTKSDEPRSGPASVTPWVPAKKTTPRASRYCSSVLLHLIDGFECVSISEAARIKRVSWRSISVQIQRETLPHVRVGDRLFIPLEALEVAR